MIKVNIAIIIPQFYLFSAMHLIKIKDMSLIIEKIEKLFIPKQGSLDTKVWIQKVILKKYLKKN